MRTLTEGSTARVLRMAAQFPSARVGRHAACGPGSPGLLDGAVSREGSLGARLLPVGRSLCPMLLAASVLGVVCLELETLLCMCQVTRTCMCTPTCPHAVSTW